MRGGELAHVKPSQLLHCHSLLLLGGPLCTLHVSNMNHCPESILREGANANRSLSFYSNNRVPMETRCRYLVCRCGCRAEDFVVLLPVKCCRKFHSAALIL